MADDEDIAALVVDNGSGMCKGMLQCCFSLFVVVDVGHAKIAANPVETIGVVAALAYFIPACNSAKKLGSSFLPFGPSLILSGDNIDGRSTMRTSMYHPPLM